MKRLLLLITLVVISVSGLAQTIPLNPTPRTPISGQPVRVIWDQYFRAGRFMWIPYTNSTTPTLNNVIDSVGGAFQLTSDGYLNTSKGLGTGYFKFPNLDQVNALITTATTGNLNILNQTSTLQAASFRISGTGQLAKVGLGSGATTSVNFDNRANITGAASSTAELVQASVQSGVTTTAYGKRFIISTAAASFTLPNLYVNSVSGGTTGAGSTLSAQTAYNVESSFTNATLNYGFRSNLSLATGVFSNYHPGTAQNYFNGNMTIGTTTDNGEKLQVNGKVTIASPPTNPTDAVRKGELDLKQNLVTLTTTGTSGAATFNQSTGALNIPNYTSGSGTVTDVSSANTDISVATGTSTPVLTLNSGTGASQIVKRDASARVTDIVPSIVQGDLLIGAGAGIMARLAKNASSTRYLSNTGTSNDPAWAQVALSTGVSGILPGVNGGTGQNTYTVGDILYASSTTNLSKRAIGTTGYLLTVSGGLPVWADPSAILIQNQVASDQIAGFRVSSTSYANGGMESRDFYRLRKTGSLAFAIDLQLAAPSANRIQTLQNDDGIVALTKNSTGYTINTTTTALTSVTLNSTYPDVDLGYRVICGDVTGAPVIYTKYTEAGSSDVWLITAVTVAP
jgi:hypothetical protein